jgi:hypothetical protein
MEDSQHAHVDHDEEHVKRAFDRARRVLKLCEREGLPPPSVELFSDGSARFIFPGRLGRALVDDADAIMALIGSDRLQPVIPLDDPDAVSVHVCCTLGREED